VTPAAPFPFRPGRVAGLIVISAALLLSGCDTLLGRSAPLRDGTVAAPGLLAPVSVIRDRVGIPHIYAGNDHDLCFAQGYVHAQDRLFQIDLERRLARGELSELFGEATLPADRLFRHLGFGARAGRIVASWPASTRSVVSAYCDGVNAGMKSLRAWPVELRLLRAPPRPFTPEDVAAVSLLKSFGLAQWEPEEILHRLSLRLPPAQFAEAFPEVDPRSPTIVARRDGIAHAAPAPTILREGIASLAATVGVPRSAGSNSWVVSGARSASGKPFLANDPHLDLMAPSIWYETHLVAPGVDVHGMSFVCAPGVVIGHNPRIAWGFTNLMADDADFFVERIDGDRVMYRKAWVPLTARTETIRVKDRAPETVVVRETPHGPILSPVLPGVTAALSLRWTGFDGGDPVGALYALDRARDKASFLAALARFPHPCQNVVYADVEGNIGMAMAGNIPVRKGGDRLLPVPGDDGAWEWTGVVPFEEKPQAWNPPEGFVATANFPVADDARFARYVSRLYEPPDRGRRIRAMLSSAKRITPADLEAMQADVSVGEAEATIALAQHVAQRRSGENPAFREAAAMLSSWDRRATADSGATLVYEQFCRKLAERLFAKAMGPALFESFVGYPRLAWNATDRIVRRGDSAFLEEPGTGRRSSLDDVAAGALLDAMASLKERLGSATSTWRWGALHQVTFSHPFGKNRFLSRWFDVGPFPVGGDGRTVSKQEFPLAERDFPVRTGPSMRMIVTPGDRDAARSSIATGQSGHFFEPHYADQVKGWLAGKGHPNRVSKAAVEADAESRLRLLPGKD
jgi:penicillin amidase